MALVTRGLGGWGLRALAWGGVGLLGAACGDALVDERYQGTPRVVLRGSVEGRSEIVTGEQPEVNVALFWISDANAREARLLEQEGTSRGVEYSRPFTLKVFDEPGEAHFLRWPFEARVAVARLGAYRDENGNGRRDETEPLLGGSEPRLVLRAPQALSAAESPTGGAVEAGWYVVSAPLECPPPPGSPPPPEAPPPVPEGECGVPLGAPCTMDAQCGPGVCLRDFVGPWPGGACAIPEPPPSGCRQRGSVLLRDIEYPERAFWINACERSADCGRGFPYQCDLQLRGCRATGEVPVQLSDSAPSRVICRPRAPSPPP